MSEEPEETVRRMNIEWCETLHGHGGNDITLKTDCDGCLADAIREALATARREALEEAAKVADGKPFHDSEIAGLIRALADSAKEGT